MEKSNIINDRIEAMLISKIAHYRLKIRTGFRNRHSVAWPELSYNIVTGSIKDLRVWLRMAELVDEAQYRMPKNPITPYTTYQAKQLSQ